MMKIKDGFKKLGIDLDDEEEDKRTATDKIKDGLYKKYGLGDE